MDKGSFRAGGRRWEQFCSFYWSRGSRWRPGHDMCQASSWVRGFGPGVEDSSTPWTKPWAVEKGYPGSLGKHCGEIGLVEMMASPVKRASSLSKPFFIPSEENGDS